MGIHRKHLWLAVLMAVSIAAGAMFRMSPLGVLWQPSSALHLLTHISLFALVTALFTASTHSWATRLLFFFVVVFLGVGTEFYEHMVGRIPLETPDVLLDTLASGSSLVFTSAFMGVPELNGYPLRISPQIVLRRRFGRPVVQRMRELGARARLPKGASMLVPLPGKLQFLSSYAQG